MTPDQWKQLFLKPLSELGPAYATDAAKAFSFADQKSTQIRRFQSNGATWWGAAKPFRLGTELTLRILVLLPESDLHASLNE